LLMARCSSWVCVHSRGGPLVGQRLRELPEHLPKAEARVGGDFIARVRSVSPEGDTVIESGDEVFFLAARTDIKKVMSELRKQDDPVQKGRHRRVAAISVSGSPVRWRKKAAR